jgi:ABC-type multidrug transport system permease subunit
MTTAWGGILPEGRHGGDSLQYLLAAAFGVLTGWIDIKVGDLLFTAILVLASCMLLGFIRPRNAWRWVLLIGIFVPFMEWLAYVLLSQKPARAQIYESFLAFLPGIVGAYGGAFGRTLVDNLFPRKQK